MILVALNIPKEAQNALELKLRTVLTELHLKDNFLLLFLDATSHLNLYFPQKSHYSDLKETSTILVTTIPARYADNPNWFLKQLKIKLSHFLDLRVVGIGLDQTQPDEDGYLYLQTSLVL